MLCSERSAEASDLRLQASGFVADHATLSWVLAEAWGLKPEA